MTKGTQVQRVAGTAQDPFWLYAKVSKSARELGESVSRVTCNAGRSLDYGNVKCGFIVSVDCPQDESSINAAAEMAFRKAVELTNDGMSHLAPEVPPLPEVE